MHFITMNRQTIIPYIRLPWYTYSLMPNLCPHKISQLGGIDEINDNHELELSRAHTPHALQYSAV